MWAAQTPPVLNSQDGRRSTALTALLVAPKLPTALCLNSTQTRRNHVGFSHRRARAVRYTLEHIQYMQRRYG